MGCLACLLVVMFVLCQRCAATDSTVWSALQDYVTEISSVLVEANSNTPEAVERIEKLMNEVVSRVQNLFTLSSTIHQ